jgi:NTP pyrophosphatase (non-canonical NTP hydrolase)
MTYREILEYIANHYGLDSQLNQLVEECGELLQAVGKYRRVTGHGQPVRTPMSVSEAIKHIAEEIADVEICLEEVTHLLGCEKELRDFIIKKLDRSYEPIKPVEKDELEHDGCLGCRHESKTEDEYPCCKCKGTNPTETYDFYRRKVIHE